MRLVLRVAKSFIKKCLKRASNKKKMKWLDARSLSRITEKTTLSETQKKEVNDVWNKYVRKICYDSHSFYYEKTKVFSPFYIPDSIHFIIIDHYYNNWEFAKYIDNKCYYHKLFCGVRQPLLIGYRLNGYWYNDKDVIVEYNIIKESVRKYEECFIKKATESYGGKGVFCYKPRINSEADFDRIIDSISSDLVVQEGITQSEALSKLHDSSVNTIRAISFLKRDGTVKIYSMILRMGVDNSRVDNASSGGITCGIDENGRLKRIAYSVIGDKYYEHPTSHVRFDEIIIPSLPEIKHIVNSLHPKFPHFRLISWDIAIDNDNQPVLIEANFCDGEVDFHQLNNGPLFKEDTIEILDEVFGFVK